MFGDIETFQIRPQLWRNEVHGIGRLGSDHSSRREATEVAAEEARIRGVTLRVRDESDQIILTVDHRRELKTVTPRSATRRG